MRIYHNISEVLSDRRSGLNLCEIFDSLIHSPHILLECPNSFDLFESLYQHDYLDMSTESWFELPTATQMLYASHYQLWYSKVSNIPVVNYTHLGFSDGDDYGVLLRLIPPGKYRMGPASSSKAVKIAKPFLLGKYEVSQGLVEAVGPSDLLRFPPGWYYTPGSSFQGYERPVENVSLTDCLRFCKRHNLDLPYEKEWEYACRAGTTSDYNFDITTGKLLQAKAEEL